MGKDRLKSSVCIQIRDVQYPQVFFPVKNRAKVSQRNGGHCMYPCVQHYPVNGTQRLTIFNPVTCPKYLPLAVSICIPNGTVFQTLQHLVCWYI